MSRMREYVDIHEYYDSTQERLVIEIVMKFATRSFVSRSAMPAGRLDTAIERVTANDLRKLEQTIIDLSNEILDL